MGAAMLHSWPCAAQPCASGVTVSLRAEAEVAKPEVVALQKAVNRAPLSVGKDCKDQAL